MSSGNFLNILGIEKGLRHEIQCGDMPFLGLYSDLISSDLTQSLQNDLINGEANAFHKRFNLFPALLATYLTTHVVDRYGEEGDATFWPFIKQALQLDDELTSAFRKRLWSSYRKACIRLGLSVTTRLSGTGYMRDEFLRQAGVPVNFAEVLANKMLSCCRQYGLPDEEDQNALSLWQESLLSMMTYGVPQPVKSAIEQDDTHFYIRLFISLLNADPESSQTDSTFLREFRNAIEIAKRKGGKVSVRTGMRIFKIVLNDGMLGVELPAGEDLTWAIKENSTENLPERHFAGRLESRFIPFDSALPLSVEVSNSEGQSRVVTLWDEQRNNRMLMFKTNGTITGQVMELGAEKPYHLEPGEYTAISRFRPDEFNETAWEVSDNPTTYAFNVTLDPAERLLLSRGPAQLEIVGDSRPLIRWISTAFKGIRGNELHCSKDTKIEVIIPPEYLDSDIRYLLKINPVGIGDPTEIYFNPDAQGKFTLDLTPYQDEWKAGLGRILTEVRRSDVNRAMVRQTIHLWNGLEEVVKRTQFLCSRAPQNLLETESDNLKSNGNVVTFRNMESRVFRMLFDLGENRKMSYSWAVPGIFLQHKEYRGETTTERSLPLGVTLPMAANSRSVLEIFASNDAMLELGRFHKRVNFASTGRDRIPLAGLTDHLGPGADTLVLREIDSGLCFDLVRLIAPHKIVDFKLRKTCNPYRVLFATSNEVEEIQVRATETISGDLVELNLSCNYPAGISDDNYWGWLTCSGIKENGLFEHEIQLDLENWPDGAWLVCLDAKINGRWGRFSDRHDHHFATGFVLNGGHLHKSIETLLPRVLTLESHSRLEAFTRAHKALKRRYAPEVEPEIEWLLPLCNNLIRPDDLKTTPSLWAGLISLEDLYEADTNHAQSLFNHYPEIFGQPASVYKTLPEDSPEAITKCLKTATLLEEGITDLLWDGILNQMMAFGFANFHQMIDASQSEPAKAFDMKRYESAIKMEDLSERVRLLHQDDWRPGKGDYLGALHYLYAFNHMRERFDDAMTSQNSLLPQALSLCLQLKRYRPHGLPTELNNGQSLSYPIDLTQEEMPLKEEQLLEVTKFLSYWAKISRIGARRPDVFNAAWTYLQQRTQNQAAQLVDYLINTGREMFGFYLLLWEAVMTTIPEFGKEDVHV